MARFTHDPTPEDHEMNHDRTTVGQDLVREYLATEDPYLDPRSNCGIEQGACDLICDLMHAVFATVSGNDKRRAERVEAVLARATRHFQVESGWELD